MAEYEFTYVHVFDQAGAERPTEYRESNNGSPNYSFDEDSSSSERIYYSPWTTDPACLKQIRMDFLGYPSVASNLGSGAGKYISRYVPHAHPDFSNELYAKAISASPTVPRGQDDFGVGRGQEAMLRVTYQAPPYPILTDSELTGILGSPDESSLLRFCSIDQQAAAKFQTIPSTSPIRWAPRATFPADGGPSPGTPVANTRAVLLFEGDLSVTWHQIPIAAYPKTAVKACIGSCNSGTFGNAASILGEVYAAGTLVCGTPKKKVIRLPNGEFGFDITYIFKWYPFGANSFYFMQEGKTAGFYPTMLDPAGTATPALFLYKSSAFNPLFRPEP